MTMTTAGRQHSYARTSSVLSGFTRDEAEREQRRIIGLIAQGAPKDDVLAQIARFLDDRLSGENGINLLSYEADLNILVGTGGHLRVPESLLTLTDDLTPADARGADATAAFRNEQVITSHIVGHPLWAGVEGHLTKHKFYAAWATPVVDAEGGLLGVVGVYLPEERTPSSHEYELLDLVAYLCSLAFQRYRSDEIIRNQARSDWLTGLFNQTTLVEQADQAIVDQDSDRLTGMLFVAMEDLEQVAESYGHKVADELLRHVAQRLRADLPPATVTARPNDGAFAVLVPNCDQTYLMELAGQVQALMRRPFDVGIASFHLSAAVGVAWTDATTSGEGLLKRAGLASVHARRLGRGSTTHYEHSMADRFRNIQHIITKLRDAIDAKQIDAAYQPIVDLATGEIVAAEALARWSEESPAVFIPVAERAGLVHQIGMIILDKALAATKHWVERSPEFTIHVNLSPEQLLRPDLVFSVGAALERHGVDPHRLVLELTEDADLTSEEAKKTMDALIRFGVALSLDDFGTGYSSPSRLMGTKFDTIKIDRSFVSDLERSEKDIQVARLLMAFGRELELPVIAEGVETEAQRTLLLEMGCPLGQGFLFSRPLPEEEFTRTLATSILAHPTVISRVRPVSGAPTSALLF